MLGASKAAAQCMACFALPLQLDAVASCHLFSVRATCSTSMPTVPPLPPPRAAGDGMVHAVRIRDGKASYCNRWVHTSRVEQEEQAGWALHTKSERAARPGAARVGWNRGEHGWCWQQVGCACR